MKHYFIQLGQIESSISFYFSLKKKNHFTLNIFSKLHMLWLNCLTILEKEEKVKRDEVWVGRKLPLSLCIISGLRYESLTIKMK